MTLLMRLFHWFVWLLLFCEICPVHYKFFYWERESWPVPQGYYSLHSKGTGGIFNFQL